MPAEFLIFGLTLAGVALFHRHALPIAATGLAAVIAFEWLFTQFPPGAGAAGLAAHVGHEWVTLLNLLLLLNGFALVARHFEESGVPAVLPRWLPDDWTGAFALLGRRPQFRALWFALALSYSGSGAAVVALTLYVQQTRGTGTAVAALLIAEGVPRLFGPVLGGLAERHDLRRLMIGADLGQAALFAGIALLPPFPVLLALTAATSALQTVYSPARTTVVPALVDEDELLVANALTGTASNLFIVVGPVVGAVLFAAAGAGTAIAVNAATFVASALLTALIPSVPPEEHRDEEESLWAGARTGFRYAMGDPLTRTVMLTLFLMFSFIAIDNVAVVFLVRETLDGSATAYGLVSACFGIGMIAASLTIARGSAVAPALLLLISVGLSTTGTLLTAVAPAIAVVGAVQMVSGAGNGLEIVASETILHQRVPRHMLGRVAGLLTTATACGIAVAMALGGFLVDVASPRFAMLVAGCGGLAGLLLAAPVLLREGRREATDP